MKTTIIIGLIVLGLSATMSFAFDDNNTVMIYGPGTRNCAEVTEAIKNTSDGEKAFDAYIRGFLSGYNTAKKGKDDFVDNSPPIANYKYVIKHCEDNPLDNLFIAIKTLVLEFNDEF